MHLYTHCKFCACELPQATNRYKAFCNSECKRLGRIYGTIKSMNLGFKKDPTPNRKTARRQGVHKSIKAVSFDLVEANDGSLHRQFCLDLVTPVSKTPLVLTGGSISPKKEL